VLKEGPGWVASQETASTWHLHVIALYKEFQISTEQENCAANHTTFAWVILVSAGSARIFGLAVSGGSSVAPPNISLSAANHS